MNLLKLVNDYGNFLSEALNEIKSETKQRVKKKELKNKLSACPTINCDGKGNLNPNSKSTRHWSARNCPNKRNLFIKI